MSDEEEVMSGEEEEETKSEDEEEEEEEARAPPRKMAPPEDEGPSEAELAMQRRREQLGNIAGVDEQTMELLELARIEREREEEEIAELREKRKRRQQQVVSSDDLDETAQELLEANKREREQMEEEIQELRERREKRKRERQEEEQRLAERRSEEEARRKAEEEERRRKKDEEEATRREQRAAKMAEFEKWKNPPKPNFVISKRDPSDSVEEGEEPRDDRKSKEQLEAEKRAILAQRIQPLSIQGFDSGKLSEKAKELHNLIYRLESEKYDLEKRFKEQQFDMMELAERARQMNKVGEKRRQMREGDAREGLKRVQMDQEEIDPIQERFAGAPAKIEMYSKYERQKDKRKYVERHEVFHGPSWCFPAERIRPCKKIEWDENTGLPSYVDAEGGEVAAEEAGEEEE